MYNINPLKMATYLMRLTTYRFQFIFHSHILPLIMILDVLCWVAASLVSHVALPGATPPFLT